VPEENIESSRAGPCRCWAVAADGIGVASRVGSRKLSGPKRVRQENSSSFRYDE